MKKTLLTLLLLLVLGFTGVVFADSTPAIISFQGQLRENGIPVSGNKTMHFKILNESLVTVWESDPVNTNQVPVTVVNGIYTVALGDTSLSNMAALPSSSLDKNQKLSLRVRVGTEDLTPDILLSAVPFAYIAKQAETITQNISAGNSVVLALRQATQNVGIGNTNPTNLFQVSENALVVSASGKVAIGSVDPLTDFEIRKDVTAGLGPILSLTNYNGSTGAGGSIDFHTYFSAGNPAEARIQSYDNNWSSDLIFYTKVPGAAGNPLVDRLRILNSGNIGIGNSAPTNLFQVSVNALVVSSNGNVGVGTENTIVNLTIDGGLATIPSTVVNLTADNQVVNVGNSSFIQLSSNNGTATQRTFLLSDGLVAGQKLVIQNTLNSCQFQDSANANIAGNNSLGAGDTLSLIWDGSQWIELSRSNN